MDNDRLDVDPPDAVAAAQTETETALAAADAKLLCEIGFLAAYQGDVARADAVFDALVRIRPGRAYPWVGKTLARFHVGLAHEAAVFLERAPATDPDEVATLQVWRGFALLLSGHAQQARTLLQKLAKGSGPHHDLARSLLGLPEEN